MTLACGGASEARAEASGEFCEEFLLGKGNADESSSLVAYLQQLLDEQILNSADLERILEALGRGELLNPLEGAAGVTDLVHRKNIDAWIEKSAVDARRFEEWARQVVEERGLTRVQRDSARAETLVPHLGASFVPVPAGSFRMGEPGKEVDVTLTHDFEVMDIDVTQGMWVQEFGENPAHFQEGPNTIEVEIHGRRIKMQPDNPIENITWWSMLEYANRKSIEANLPPVYDFSEIAWDETTGAAAGTLAPSSLDGRDKLRINAPDGDIYRAQGYRLPLEAEWEYLMTDLGRAQGEYPHGLTERGLFDVAWFNSNADSMTHPVATTARSLLINGRPVHDLVGNVWKLMHNIAGVPEGGVNPTGPNYLWIQAMRGGSWYTARSGLKSAEQSASPALSPADCKGGRLVRTLR